MKSFQQEIQDIKSKILRREYFSLARYGDGEMMIMKGESIDLLGKANGEFKYDPSSKKDEEYREKLLKAFRYCREGYFIGIGCPCCVGNSNFQWMKRHSRQDEASLTWANLLVNGNYKTFLTEIVPLFSEMDVYIVCNSKATLERLSFKENIVKDWRVTADAWKGDDTILSDFEVLSPKGSLFLFAAGPYSKILCHQMWSRNQQNFYIDIGSTMDPWLFGPNGYTRGYLRGAPTLNKICIWGN
jgi:hypothetical protein